MSLLAFWAWQGWDALVALGTIGLAAFTAWLAWTTRSAVRESRDSIKLQAREVEAVERQTTALADQTQAVRDQAEATQRQAELSAASLEAAARPVLVGATPAPTFRRGREEIHPEQDRVVYLDDSEFLVARDNVHYHEADDKVYCSVVMRNVGSGVAFVQRIDLLTGPEGMTSYQGRVSNPVIPPGDTARFLFTAVLRQSDGRATDANSITASGRGFAMFTVYVVYTAASRQLVAGTEATVSQLPSGDFIFTEQRIFDGETTERKLLVSTHNIAL